MKKRVRVFVFVFGFLTLTFHEHVFAQVWRSNPFNCTITSAAAGALTQITGCGVLTGGQRRYITDIVWSSSIISTTVNYFLLRAGTGADCVTGPVSLFADFTAPAYAGRTISFQTPIVAPANNALCFIHSGAGTRNITVNGYIQ